MIYGVGADIINIEREAHKSGYGQYINAPRNA